MNEKYIIADGRWTGAHGIGRFSTEILSRLKHHDINIAGPAPLSMKNIFWQPYQLRQLRKSYRVYFSPGFNPVLTSAMPVVFTIHDLIHLEYPGSYAFLKKLYYQSIMKIAAQQAAGIITVSNYSKNKIMEWGNIAEDKIHIVSNGVSAQMSPQGEKYCPGYPYLLHIGNSKPHKNVARLVEAFAHAHIDSGIKLILTGQKTELLMKLVRQNKLENRVVWRVKLSDKELAELYRGAMALVFPSLMEGFGIPVIEAMACGIPVITSNTTSLPEVAGDAALLVDPLEVEEISRAIEVIVHEDGVRERCVEQGLLRATRFSWDASAEKIQKVLDRI